MNKHWGKFNKILCWQKKHAVRIGVDFLDALKKQIMRRRITLFKKGMAKSACVFLLAMVFVVSQAQLFNAFEAHVINVTAEIVNPVELFLPNGGEELICDDIYNITWLAIDPAVRIGNVASIDLHLSSDGGSTYPYVIAAGQANSGAYSWTIPNIITTQAKVRIIAYYDNGPDQGDVSDEVFSITCSVAPPEPTDVVINEVYYDVSGLCSGDEFIEIYNPTVNPVDLTNYKIGDEETSGDGEGMYQFPLGTSIGPGQFIVIARRASVFKNTFSFYPDFEWISDVAGVPNMIKYSSWATGYINLADGGDEILLLDGSDNAVDVVIYENGSYPNVIPHSGVVTGHSIARNPAGKDTDDCSSDFEDLTTPNPGTNPHTAITAEVVLNEFLPNASSTPEFIELYNKGDEEQDVAGWKIKFSGTSTEIIISSAILYGVETNTIIGTGQWLAIDLLKVADDILNDISDTIYLYNENDNLKDEVFYPLGSGSNSAPTPGEENAIGDVINPPDKSYARIPDGAGAWVDPIPTPGEPNILETTPDIVAPGSSVGDFGEAGEGELADDSADDPLADDPADDPLVDGAVDDPADDPLADGPAGEPADDFVDDPADDPADGEPVDGPADDPADGEFADDPADGPADDSLAKELSDDQADDPLADGAVDDPADDPLADGAVDDPADDPLADGAAGEPADGPADDPLADGAAGQPADDLTNDPFNDPADDPADEPLLQTVKQEQETTPEPEPNPDPEPTPDPEPESGQEIELEPDTWVTL